MILLRSMRIPADLLTRLIARLVAVYRRVNLTQSHPVYRPEKHYMRGPGPKTKHGATASGDPTPKAT